MQAQKHLLLLQARLGAWAPWAWVWQERAASEAMGTGGKLAGFNKLQRVAGLSR